ncbi:MAG: aconitase X catalytic domain-containing protein [Eubacteriales bacterium]|nr:aconitase X catalytic domain-containing protein [Eubacteriales bacterium]
MKLTQEEKDILAGKQGETMAKILKTVVDFGDVFGANKLVPITHASHFVTSFGIGLLKPLFRTMDEIIDAGIKTKEPFTVDPRPIDYANVKCNLLNKLVFSKIMYKEQKRYEEQLKKIGLKDDKSFTCTCYFEEVGNLPKKGDILGWAESSAVVYANSVIGARCNRNSGMLDLFSAIIGKVPEFGLLTDEGRKADWIIDIQTSKLPEAQILGSAIGLKVMEDVPYVKGLDRFLGNELTDDVKGYLKDFGAATASNGAVGLYHIDGLTPEAKELGKKLIKKDAKVYTITDKELEKVYKSYPVLWKNVNAKPTLCFIGCPHLSRTQLENWAKDILSGLKNTGRKKVTVKTILTTSPQIADKFRETELCKELYRAGVKVSSICPLMYTNNPLAGKKPIITCSNKLRTYSSSRFYKSDDILKIITGGNK